MKPSVRATARLISKLTTSAVYEFPGGFLVIPVAATVAPTKRRRRTREQMEADAATSAVEKRKLAHA